jgi:hypothetical protein
MEPQVAICASRQGGGMRLNARTGSDTCSSAIADYFACAGIEVKEPV